MFKSGFIYVFEFVNFRSLFSLRFVIKLQYKNSEVTL